MIWHIEHIAGWLLFFLICKNQQKIYNLYIHIIYQYMASQKKNKGWRPTKYKEEYCELIVSYFRDVQWEIYYDYSHFKPSKLQVEKHYELLWSDKESEMDWGIKRVEPKIINYTLPTFARWASRIGINESTLYERAKKHPQFSKSLGICKQIQKAMLIELWLNWIYNSTITQLMLKNNHGFRDKQELEHTGANGWPIEVTQKQVDAVNSLLWKLWTPE